MLTPISKPSDFSIKDEQVLLDIINKVSDPIFVKDRKHRWILLNDAYCLFMGYPRQKLIGKTDYDFFSDKEAKVFWSKDEMVFKNGKENINEELFTDARGVTHNIITKKNVFKSGNKNFYLVGIISDITERKKIEDALHRQQQEIEVILDSVPAWIFYKDINNRFIRVNRAFSDVMGMSKKQLQGKSMFDLFSKDQAQAYWDDDKEVIRMGKAKRNIIETLVLPNKTLWVQTDKIPYRDAAGDIVGVIGFTLDITKRRLAENSLKEKMRDLERLNELMVGRELRIIKLKEQLRKGSVEQPAATEKSWSQKFQEAVELEDDLVQSLTTDYLAKISSYDLSAVEVRKIKKLLEQLLEESREHEKKFKELIKYENKKKQSRAS
ncbi:MAG: PAS domain S-box protein [Patescibacteria group bacterium]|jgi:PAS domain S-box-containing protein